MGFGQWLVVGGGWFVVVVGGTRSRSESWYGSGW